MRQLVICGQCELTNGTQIKKWVGHGMNIEVRRMGSVVLGEIAENGDFLIKRGGQFFTTITGDNFSVLCGNCGNAVYQRQQPTIPVKYEFQHIEFRGTLPTS